MSILRFGKNKGKELSACDTDYLNWLLNPLMKNGTRFNVYPEIQEEARKILADRAVPTQEELKQVMTPLKEGELDKLMQPVAGFSKEQMLKLMDELDHEINHLLKEKRLQIAEM